MLAPVLESSMDNSLMLSSVGLHNTGHFTPAGTVASQMANRDMLGIASLSELQLWRELTSGSAGERMNQIPPCPRGLGCSMGAANLLQAASWEL